MRWERRRRRLAALGAVGIATAGVLIVFPGTSQGSAEGPYYFKCVGPLADNQTIAASISLSSKELTVGQQLVINWQLGDAQRSVKVPDPLNPNHDKGGHLAVTARVKAHGVWTGQGAIDSTGTRLVEADDLRTGKPLSLGLVSPGLATAERAGPGRSRSARSSSTSRPSSRPGTTTSTRSATSRTGTGRAGTRSPIASPYFGKTHYEQDLREAKNEDEEATFTFVGTGVDLFGDKKNDMSEFTLVTDQGNPPDEASERYNAYWSVAGERRVLEKFTAATNLPYGKYTVKIKNKTQDKFARVDAWKVYANTADNLNALALPHGLHPEPKFPLIPLTVTAGGNGSPSPDPSGSPLAGPSGSPSARPVGQPVGVAVDQPVRLAVALGQRVEAADAAGELHAAGVGDRAGHAHSHGDHDRHAHLDPDRGPGGDHAAGRRRDGVRRPNGSNSGLAVLALGALMLMGGMFSGLKLLRRRAAHAGER